MGPVTFERAGPGLQIQPTGFLPSGHLPSDRNADGAWRAMSLTDTFSVRSLLREFVSGDSDCRKLRDLIGGLGRMVPSRLSNVQLIDTAAEMIAARRLLVLEKVHEADSSGKRQVMRAATVKLHAKRARQQANSVEESAFASRCASCTRASPALEECFVANVNQDVQAGVLKATATTGVPFCEVYEKANQAKAEHDIQQFSAS